MIRSAAGTGVVKCTKIPPLEGENVTCKCLARSLVMATTVSHRFTNTSQDVAADIAIWGAVEIATTIMASCIPVLRVLLHYIKSSAKQYHTTHLEPSDGSHMKGSRANITTVTSPGNRKRGGTHVGEDDDSGSDKSILERSVGVANQIVQVTEYTVQFHNQGNGKMTDDSDSMGGYEMTNRTPAA